MTEISCKLLALGSAVTAHQPHLGNATFPISDQDNKRSSYLHWEEAAPKGQALWFRYKLKPYLHYPNNAHCTGHWDFMHEWQNCCSKIINFMSIYIIVVRKTREFFSSLFFLISLKDKIFFPLKKILLNFDLILFFICYLIATAILTELAGFTALMEAAFQEVQIDRYSLAESLWMAISMTYFNKIFSIMLRRSQIASLVL